MSDDERQPCFGGEPGGRRQPSLRIGQLPDHLIRFPRTSPSHKRALWHLAIPTTQHFCRSVGPDVKLLERCRDCKSFLVYATVKCIA